MRVKFKETATLSLGKDKVFNESLSNSPSVIYPEIHAITASSVTRNKTFYPESSLTGAGGPVGSGLSSLTFPYQIPIIRDHQVSSDYPGGCPIYGRAISGEMKNDGVNNYLSVIAAISDPEAVDAVLTGRFLTVSIGVEAESVHCSVCNTDLSVAGCDHEKGKIYDVGGVPQEAYYIIGPIWFNEISFVTVPSDPNARVISVTNDMSYPGIGIGGESYMAKKNTMWSVAMDITKKSGRVPLSEAAKDSDILTLGQLYGLGEDDPDYAVEATMDAKTRNALSDSDFCGPDRSFPAQDANHARNGLARLDQYKGPGSKSSIKACLLRKLQQHKKKESAISGNNLAILADEKYGFQLPVFSVNEHTVLSVYDDVVKSSFPEEYKNKVLQSLARFCRDNKISRPKDLEEVYKALGDGQAEPCVIPLNEFTYPILYGYVDFMERCMMEALLDAEESDVKSASPKEESHINEAVVEKSVETPVLVELTTVKAENESLKEGASALNDKCLDLFGKLHKRVAHEAAILSKVLNEPIGRGKSLDELTNILGARTESSLSDLIHDLMLKFDGDSVVDTNRVEKVENPVVISNEQVADLKRTLTNKETMEKSVTLTDENDGSVFLHSGLDIETLNKRVAERMKAHSIK